MGRRKAAIEIGGRSFLQRVIDAARPVFDEVVLVERPGGPEVDAVRTIHESPHEASGPIFGVERALEDGLPGRTWIVAIDYPLLTPEILADLRARYDRSNVDLMVPWWNDQPQLLCAGYDAALLGEIREMVRKGQYRLRSLLDRVSTGVVTEEELRQRHAGEPLLNVNVPADLTRARRIDEEAHASGR